MSLESERELSREIAWLRRQVEILRSRRQRPVEDGRPLAYQPCLFRAGADRATIGVGQYAYWTLVAYDMASDPGTGTSFPLPAPAGPIVTKKAVNCFELNWARGLLDFQDYNVTGFYCLMDGLVLATQVGDGAGRTRWVFDYPLVPIISCTEP